METVYDIWRTDTPPFFEVVVVCDTCFEKVAKCECEDEEQCNEL